MRAQEAIKGLSRPMYDGLLLVLHGGIVKLRPPVGMVHDQTAWLSQHLVPDTTNHWRCHACVLSCGMILVYRRTSMATVKTIGRSGQIVLGKEYAGRSVLVDQVEPGVWIIKVGEFVPDSERWFYEAQVQQEVEEAIAWAERNPPHPTDIEALAAHLTP